ncbi:SdpI family protein [Acholeplasma granularum]|uniref:SdpI family protein n=1 Tax=Acholeplasma granularum TaxID=264635 RepID=UPI000472FD31|nr:SdpI family protein [Acholeplasma granularum]
MWMIIFFVITINLIPLMMFIFGLYFHKSPPKEISDYIGYRTKYSKLNQDTWTFANKFMGILWFRLSFVVLAFSLIPIPFIYNKNQEVIAIILVSTLLVQTLILIISIIPVEIALRKHFDSKGNRK